MDIAIHGKNMDTGASLQEHIRDAISRSCEKYFGSAISADVTVTKEAYLYRTNISLHLMRGTLLRSEGSAGDPYASVKESMEALDKQLRRLKRKVTDAKRD